jgi:hypothetical protein
MGDEVEKPVAQDNREDQYASAPIPADQEVPESKERSPSQICDKAVTDGVVIQVERICGSDPRFYAEMLNTGQDQRPTKEISEKRRQNQRSQRRSWSEPFGCKGDTVVRDEHCLLPQQRIAAV